MHDRPPITLESPLEQVDWPQVSPFWVAVQVATVQGPFEQGLAQQVQAGFGGALQVLVMLFEPLFHALQDVCESDPY